MLLAAAVRTGAEIDVGGHAVTTTWGPLTISLDIVWGTLVAAGVVLLLGFMMRARATAGVPGKLQLVWELLLEQVTEIAESALGKEAKRFIPLALSIFVFILACNWLEMIPSGHNPEWLPAPTADVNLPLAMALTVIFLVHYNAIKARGAKQYFKHYTQPYVAMLPINIIEEITKPITLTFRLFGNMFASVLMVTVLTSLLPVWAFWVGELPWKIFAMFIGVIQAFIFALLTLIYLSIGMGTGESH